MALAERDFAAFGIQTSAAPSMGLRMALYDAFISYSHAKDKPIAAALQSVVQKLGKPWYRRRALRVFRDDTSLSATPQLWPSIEQALGQSRYFILLASPEAAASKWVNKEVAYWLDHNSVDTLLIGVTDGELAWDETTGDFAAREDTPLPPVLTGRFPAEPKWVDLRAYRDGADKARRQVHRACRRLRRRHPRHAEGGPAFAGGAPAAPRADAGVVGGGVAAHPGGRGGLAMESRGRAERAQSSATGVSGAAPKRIAQVQRDRAVQAEGTATEQKQIAQVQRDRAENTLATATKTANDLVFDLAQKFRDQTGMPVSLTRRILDRTRELQQQLTESGESSAELKRSESAALSELVKTLMAQGDATAALKAAERSRAVMESLVAANPDDVLLQFNLNAAYAQEGNVLMDLGRRAEALAPITRLWHTPRSMRPSITPTSLQQGLALDYGNIGEILKREGRREEAGRLRKGTCHPGTVSTDNTVLAGP